MRHSYPFVSLPGILRGRTHALSFSHAAKSVATIPSVVTQSHGSCQLFKLLPSHHSPVTFFTAQLVEMPPQVRGDVPAASHAAIHAETRATDRNAETCPPIISGLHIWAAPRESVPPIDQPVDQLSPPLVPFKDLPFPRSERAKVGACAIRWQFTGHFNLNKEENSARGSLTIQVKRYLEYRGFMDPAFTVIFPRNVGRGRFVDVNVGHKQMMDALASAPLLFRGARLQRHLVGCTLSRSALVVELTGFSQTDSHHRTAQTVARLLQPYAQVHDIWLEMRSSESDPAPQPSNKIMVLLETALDAGGYRDFSKVEALPGYLNVNGRECRLQYIGRRDWCTICRSSTIQFHTFNGCPDRRSRYCAPSFFRIAPFREDERG